MGKVKVVIFDATGNKEQKVGLPDDVSGYWYRPDGYILSLDAPDSDNVIVDPE